MVNVLFVEDDEHKMFRVVAFLKNKFNDFQIEIARSVQGGLRYLQSHHPELIILDMSLPVFDYSTEERGFQHLAFGGKDILEYLDSLERAIPVIVLTAFEQYGSGKTAVTLEELHQNLLSEFPEQYIGHVWYSALEDKWQDELYTLSKKAFQIKRA